MSSIEQAIYDLGKLDTFAACDTPIHRLDPRAKVVVCFLFIVTVVSYEKHSLAAILPLILYPVVLASIAGLPFGYLFKKLLLAAPFAFFVGIFNPLLDREILVRIGPLGVSGGWLSFLSILARFALTVSAALILIATTGMYAVCLALERLRVPRVFVMQLLFLYRYLFLLAAEFSRIVRAHALRAPGKDKGPRLRVFGSILGHTLLRSLDRAQRIHQAMLSRGFTGEIHLRSPLRFGLAEYGFIAAWVAFCVLVRWQNIPEILGKLVVSLIS